MNIHFTNIVILKSYDIVWSWFSNPKKYPEIYPNWVARVNEIGKNKFEIIDRRNQKSLIILEANKDKGSIDLYIGNEVSRTRVFSVENNTAVVHIGTRWKQMKNPLFWFLYKKTVDKDFKNAKKVIENSPQNYNT